VIFGGVQGRNLFLEDFAPAVLDIRRQWFPMPATESYDPYAEGRRSRYQHDREAASNVESTGDPAGATNNSQGTNRSAVTVLSDMGIYVLTQQDANHPDRRNYAIQVAAGYMERNLSDGSPCFLVSDRFVVLSRQKEPQERSLLVDGLEAGYVWDKLSNARTASPNTRRPSKDGVFDHSQNTCEYAWLRWAPAAPASLAGVYYTDEERQRIERESERAKRHALRLEQQDHHDPDDAPHGSARDWGRGRRPASPAFARMSRGGY
jgi:hypothetical protein